MAVAVSSTLVQKTAAANTSILDQANASYQEGNCEKALSLFEKVSGDETLDSSQSDLVLFRSSYCYLETGDNSKALKGFKAYLKKYPSNSEARFKYTQSLFNSEKYSAAQKMAETFRSGSFTTEAGIYSARSFIELGSPDQALQVLDNLPDNGDWKPVLLYWKAVAQYHSDEEDLAKSLFNEAIRSAPASSWVKNDAQNWLDRMKKDKRPQIQLIGSYFYDGNVAQSATRSIGGVTSNRPPPGEAGGIPGSRTEEGDATYIKDHGYQANFNVYYTPINSRKFQLLTGFESYASFYLNSYSYNFETLNPKIELTYKPSSSMTLSIAANYLDSRYYYNYYQDYLGLTPKWGWAITNHFYTQISVANTINMVTRPSYSIAPALYLKWNFINWLYLTAGGSYTSANGEAATFSSGLPPYSVVSGTIFSRYVSYGGYVGLEFELPWKFYLSAQVSLYKTNYAKEDAPPPPGVTVQVDARSDTLWTYLASLSRPIIPDIWSISISGSFTNNTSTGFQGLGSGGSVPDNTYTRIYAYLSTSFYF